MTNQKIVLIAGGTGSVGEGLVKAFLDQHWQVVVPGRSKDRLDQLAAYCGNHPDLHTRLADLSDPAGADQFFRQCKDRFEAFDLVVASLGGWRQGTDLIRLTWKEWEDTLKENLSSHFLVMKHGFPLLRQRGIYVHINGMGAEAVIPGAGPVVAAAAAQMKLALTLAAEQKNSGRRVHELVLGLVNTRARNITGEKGAELITPPLIAEYIMYLYRDDFPGGSEILHVLKDAAAVLPFIS